MSYSLYWFKATCEHEHVAQFATVYLKLGSFSIVDPSDCDQSMRMLYSNAVATMLHVLVRMSACDPETNSLNAFCPIVEQNAAAAQEQASSSSSAAAAPHMNGKATSSLKISEEDQQQLFDDDDDEDDDELDDDDDGDLSDDELDQLEAKLKMSSL